MNTEKSERHATVREGYQILLRADAEVLEPLDKPQIRAFYRNMAQACMRWIQEIYGESLRRAFLSLENLRERSQFRTHRYRMKMQVVWEEDGYAAIVCESWLKGEWSEPQRGYHRISHVWNLAEETLLPFPEILCRFGMRLKKNMLPFRPDGIYPDGNEMVFFRNISEQSPFLEKRLTRQKPEKPCCDKNDQTGKKI